MQNRNTFKISTHSRIKCLYKYISTFMLYFTNCFISSCLELSRMLSCMHYIINKNLICSTILRNKLSNTINPKLSATTAGNCDGICLARRGNLPNREMAAKKSVSDGSASRVISRNQLNWASFTGATAWIWIYLL